MTGNDKATLPAQADHLGKMASKQDQLTTIIEFFQERFGNQSMTITRDFLFVLPPALNAPPSLSLKWEVKP